MWATSAAAVVPLNYCNSAFCSWMFLVQQSSAGWGGFAFNNDASSCPVSGVPDIACQTQVVIDQGSLATQQNSTGTGDDCASSVMGPQVVQFSIQATLNGVFDVLSGGSTLVNGQPAAVSIRNANVTTWPGGQSLFYAGDGITGANTTAVCTATNGDTYSFSAVGQHDLYPAYSGGSGSGFTAGPFSTLVILKPGTQIVQSLIGSLPLLRATNAWLNTSGSQLNFPVHNETQPITCDNPYAGQVGLPPELSAASVTGLSGFPFVFTDTVSSQLVSEWTFLPQTATQITDILANVPPGSAHGTFAVNLAPLPAINCVRYTSSGSVPVSGYSVAILDILLF